MLEWSLLRRVAYILGDTDERIFLIVGTHGFVCYVYVCFFLIAMT